MYAHSPLPNSTCGGRPILRRWSRFHTLGAGLLSACVFLPILYHWILQEQRKISPLFELSDHTCDAFRSNTGQRNKADIPNIVHYVWLLKDPDTFTLNFKHFVTIYSSYLFFNPDHIYIHTDASPTTFERAKSSGDTWTQRVIAIPKVTPNYIETPTTAANGIKIDRMEQKSDFLRMAALRQFGGIYLDMDAIPLRSVAHLRTSGFANVIGGAHALTIRDSNFLNGGVMMSKPGSLMMEVCSQAAEQFFDGGWNTVGPYLLTDLANRMAAIPGEVLILQPEAFAPVSYELADQKRLFKPHVEREVAIVGDLTQEWDGNGGTTCTDVLAWLKERMLEKWEIDFSSTYVLHAFDDDLSRIRGWDHVIDVKYVLARQSNYARAVYPAIRHAIEAGLIPEAAASSRLHPID
jgi:hypothetical protein